jgi:hypothetical protein
MSKFNVDDLENQINARLKLDTNSKEYREALISVIENVLMDSGNYRGFRYLYSTEVPLLEKPGINGEYGKLLDIDERFKDVDHTRVEYT